MRVVLDRILGFIIRIIAWQIFGTILDLIPKRVRKFIGWSLLVFGAVAILWAMYADPGNSGLGSGIFNIIALFVGIISAFFGFIFLLHDWKIPGFSDEAIADAYAEYEESLLRLREDGFIDPSGDTENENELIIPSPSEQPSEIIEDDSFQDSLPWVIGAVSSLFSLLVLSIILLWVWSNANDIILGGPPPTLTGWEESYRDLTGFDEVSGLDGSGVLVCVVDSGIEMDHPDLRHLTLAGWLDVIDGRDAPYDDEGHGTAMAGIIVAQDGLRGNAQGVELLVAKAIDDEGSGSDEGIAEAVNWCVDEQADIISLSLGGEGGFGFAGITTDQLEEAVQDALDLGVFVVAAAGNDGQDDDGDVSSPGSVADVICVGGATRLGNVWSGSSEGDNNGRIWPPMLPRSDPDKKPEVLAPGAEVPVLMAGGSGDGSWWGWASGTSAATAWVSGGLALILEAHPELQREGASGGSGAIDLVKEVLSDNSQMDNGQDDHDDRFGYGILRIDLMLEALGNNSSASNVVGEIVSSSAESSGSEQIELNSEEYQAERRKTPSVPPVNSTKAAECSVSTLRTNSIQRLNEATTC